MGWTRRAVLSGTLYFATGDKWDESKFKAYPAGTFYSEEPSLLMGKGRRGDWGDG